MRLRSGNASSGDERRSSVKWTAILCACSFALGILFTNRSVPNPSFNLALTLAHDLLAVAGPGRPPMPPARSSPPAGRSRSSRSSRKIAQPKGSVSIPTADLNGAGGAAERAGAERRQWLADDLCVKSAEKQGICCDRDQHRFQQQEEEGFRDKLRQLEHEKGIVIRFMIGHSTTSKSILDKAIDSEESLHNDFLRLDHVEGYHELSAKTKIFFSTAVAIWDADFYVKVDDDVHVNLGVCPLLGIQFGEFIWKKKKKNCLLTLSGFSPDCEWKAQAGNVCIASFDWSCSGICKSVEKIKDVHERCGEGDGTVWSTLF
ncbi:hypothetical protein B296_00029939 [Ensete ventricosum]|uniref:Hexosyltransferase n=1 Tax=Ensete ventricosum TaxID=4639 RepID=A0A426YC34_ENSVE|nr:hypothetical protein B296_00029939 [Ensete ventricosum]